jgi:hypothetical protein
MEAGWNMGGQAGQCVCGGDRLGMWLRCRLP